LLKKLISPIFNFSGQYLKNSYNKNIDLFIMEIAILEEELEFNGEGIKM